MTTAAAKNSLWAESCVDTTVIQSVLVTQLTVIPGTKRNPTVWFVQSRVAAAGCSTAGVVKPANQD